MKPTSPLRSILRSTRLPAALIVGLGASVGLAGAQSRALLFDLDPTASQFTYTGTTSLGPIVGTPNTFALSGDVAATLGAGANQAVNSIAFSTGGDAVVSPDITATIPNPIPFLPALAQVSITNLSLGLTSPPAAVDAAGVFTVTAQVGVISGVATVTPFGSSPSVTDLAGTVGAPQTVTGSLSVMGSSTEISSMVSLPFTLTDSSTGLSATVTLTGQLELDYQAQQPVNYCTAAANSTGGAASMGSTGTTSMSAAAIGSPLVLTTAGLPSASLGYYLFSAEEDFVPGFSGSQGNLCIGGSLFRLSNYVLSSGTAGQVSLDLPYGGLPSGLVFDIGEEWNFQYWFRDSINGALTSNTSDGLKVVLAP